MSSLVDDTPPENGLKDTAYVVLVSERLQNNTEWSSVAQSLAQKHGAKIYAYSDDLEECLPVLKKTTPHLVALVAMPEEAGHDVVRRMNVMLRKIDEDPYADARWGLVTAGSSKDAMNIVEVSEPLRVSSALSNTPIPIERVGAGTCFDEGVAGRRIELNAGGDPVEVLGDVIIAKDYAHAFNTSSPDLLVTSGRTNEERWMLGYNFDGGRVVVPEGDLLARTPSGEDIPLRNEGPTAMLGAGSCLLGHVPDASALPLAFIRHGGVRQIIGYATTTWYGRGGWDTLSKVMDEPGRHSLAEAAWLTQQDLVREVEARAPGIEIDTTHLGSRDVVEFRAAVAEATGMSATSAPLKELTGLLWDRDALVVIGDPAWDVRLNDGPRWWTLDRASGVMDGTQRLTFTVTPQDDAPQRTIAMLLPKDLRGAELIDSGGGAIVLEDDFLLISGVDDTLTVILAHE